MSKFCTTCGWPQDDCECDQSVTFEALSYTNDQYEVPDSLVRQLLWVKRNHREELDAWSEICGATPTGSNQRKAHFWTVTSVQTRTALLDVLTEVNLNDFKNLKSAVENSTDGQIKWGKVHDFWSDPETPEELADLARQDNWVEYVATLSGHETGYNARSAERYIRTVKANVMAEIFGDDDALCLDSARRDILEPLFEEMFPGRVNSTHMGTNARYRGQGVPATSDPVWPGSGRFLEDWLAYNPEEYRAITTEVLDALTDATGMTRREVSHALFILGNQDGATAHESLAVMMD